MQSIQNGSDATCSRDRMVDPSTSEAPDDSGHVMAGSVQVLYTASGRSQSRKRSNGRATLYSRAHA
jgi:hypothetical protein